jgi:long-chain-fatty-acid---luciferin-component ligase
MEFLTSAAAHQRPVVVYGAPGRLAGLLDDLAGSQLASVPGSCVVTGGGWKDAGAGDVQALLDLAASTLGVDRSRCLDTYSWSELNTVLLSCPADRYHVPPVVEALVVDAMLRPVEGDADGRLAVLDPMAASYPGMIVTSDLVRLRHDPCPCGRGGQTLLPGICRLPGAPARGCGVVDSGRAP